jgi:enoyl-[acyl-carrier protein] reductase/trans-2-enoyl-CoA reductase (NAD+)
MQLALPEFRYRFIPAAGNIIFPGNFHPVGTQRDAQRMIERATADGCAEPGSGGIWLIMGGSGGFGSGARVALGCDLGAHTISLSFDAQPNPSSGNKIRKIGSPGFHRNLALDRGLSELGLEAMSRNIDAFDPQARVDVVDLVRERFPGKKLAGLVWALAAPRGTDARTGETIKSALKPVGQAVRIRTFGAPEGDRGPIIGEAEIPPGNPEETIATQFVMGGRIVEEWVTSLLDADLVDEGFTLLSISYRGNPLNECIYRNGLIGLAKADLEYQTKALGSVLERRVGGRAFPVEGPAVITEASGGIPGIPLYMALIRHVMGEDFEDPCGNMRRMFRNHLMPGMTPQLDDEGLLRMDDRELTDEVQGEMKRWFDQLPPGAEFDRKLFEPFMAAYSRTRGFAIEGVDYQAEFDTDAICQR